MRARRAKLNKLTEMMKNYTAGTVTRIIVN
jgi:hypothetical protein